MRLCGNLRILEHTAVSSQIAVFYFFLLVLNVGLWDTELFVIIRKTRERDFFTISDTINTIGILGRVLNWLFHLLV